MIFDERKKAIEELVFKASVVGNEDYINMSEEEFLEEIKEDWIVYEDGTSGLYNRIFYGYKKRMKCLLLMKKKQELLEEFTLGILKDIVLVES